LHLTSAANYTWSAFVPLCRWGFNRDTTII